MTPLTLPPYPTRVSSLPDLQKVASSPGARSQLAYIKTVLALPVSDDRYRTDQFGTKCNFFLTDVLELNGYQLPFMLANDILQKAEVGQYGFFKRMEMAQALMNASNGSPTFAGLEELPHGHVVVVLPTAPSTDDPGNAFVAQAGASNFAGGRMARSWLAKDLPNVRFYGAP